MSNTSNDSGRRTVHLTDRTLAFALENCDTNIRQGLGFLQTGVSRETAEKLVELLENFKELKKALEEAK